MHEHPAPDGLRLPRRGFLTGVAALSALGGLRASAQEPGAAADPLALDGPLGIPGPYPGRVIEVRKPGMINNGVRDRAAIKGALDRGMAELTGADDAVSAWRSFFEPGDVVAIKMNPVGRPLANSSTELMLEIVEGLKSAGVKTRDMFVFERYRSEFLDAGMADGVPDGISWGGLTYGNDPSQLEIAWPDGDAVSGYDPDEYVSMNLIHKDHDPKDDRAFRSHLGTLITRKVNKVVLLPVLKDHGSAGITGALKNMSHGLVNNVARSHSSAEANVCNQFIPEVVSHPIIRKKCVLQIMDGIVGVYQGGPFARAENPHWTWENNALLLATDPVAMDRIEWDMIDAKRRQMGLAPVGAVGKLGIDAEREGFDMRQPQHVILSGYLGLGEYRPEKIDHRVVNA
ncbi:DUF362 domain-containing protein [Tautonia sp. JC769]|uniref:DUF362 domain-containing protein n=1 Tax=Tautonia sp. JC769 TaxID=3232135 RepID=UPI00345B434C